jgi:hypothetical protein
MAMSDHDVLSIMSTINLYRLVVDAQRWLATGAGVRPRR